jgi:hypothetical protein
MEHAPQRLSPRDQGMVYFVWPPEPLFSAARIRIHNFVSAGADDPARAPAPTPFKVEHTKYQLAQTIFHFNCTKLQDSFTITKEIKLSSMPNFMHDLVISGF